MAVDDFDHDLYIVGWICALPQEWAAAQAMLDKDYGPPRRPCPHDSNTYRLGRIGEHRVALACMPAGVPGASSATLVAKQMQMSFKSIKIGLMVGIGGGVPSQGDDIRLGDVVVSQPRNTFGGVVQYDFGKTIQGGKFIRTGALNKPPQVLLTALSAVQTEHWKGDNQMLEVLMSSLSRHSRMLERFSYPHKEEDLLYEATYDHVGPADVGHGRACTRCERSRVIPRRARDRPHQPAIHYGTIASGNQVMKDGASRDRHSRELDNVLCFEMEAAGLMDNFPCLVIRGISDYADSHKNDRWQPYAAATAAAYAKQLLMATPKADVEKEVPVERLLPAAHWSHVGNSTPMSSSPWGAQWAQGPTGHHQPGYFDPNQGSIPQGIPPATYHMPAQSYRSGDRALMQPSPGIARKTIQSSASADRIPTQNGHSSHHPPGMQERARSSDAVPHPAPVYRPGPTAVPTKAAGYTRPPAMVYERPAKARHTKHNTHTGHRPDKTPVRSAPARDQGRPLENVHSASTPARAPHASAPAKAQHTGHRPDKIPVRSAPARDQGRHLENVHAASTPARAPHTSAPAKAQHTRGGPAHHVDKAPGRPQERKYWSDHGKHKEPAHSKPAETHGGAFQFGYTAPGPTENVYINWNEAPDPNYPPYVQYAETYSGPGSDDGMQSPHPAQEEEHEIEDLSSASSTSGSEGQETTDPPYDMPPGPGTEATEGGFYDQSPYQGSYANVDMVDQPSPEGYQGYQAPEHDYESPQAPDGDDGSDCGCCCSGNGEGNDGGDGNESDCCDCLGGGERRDDGDGDESDCCGPCCGNGDDDNERSWLCC